jgi:hypothetical protein
MAVLPVAVDAEIAQRAAEVVEARPVAAWLAASPEEHPVVPAFRGFVHLDRWSDACFRRLGQDARSLHGSFLPLLRRTEHAPADQDQERKE